MIEVISMKVTQELIKKGLARFTVLFPIPEHSNKPEIVSIWYDLFHDMDAEVFTAACAQCEANLTAFPLPADVNRFAAKL
ncbi:hypothetical protein QR66_19555 [Chromobacterium piscinae]|nr:hypothetical protein QR66_19555 [Chromobacterium piscinae]